MAFTENLTFHSVPVYVLLIWVVYELVAAVCRRRIPAAWAEGVRFLGWALRPWAAWAMLNAVFRWRWAGGFNNRRTFPFFANLWHEQEPLRETAARVLSSPLVWGWSAVVAALLLILLLVVRHVVRQREPTRPEAFGIVLAAYLLSISLNLAIGSLPEGMGRKTSDDGSLLSCWLPHATMLYTVPVIQSTEHFLDHFIELQPQLRRTIHGLSHPPGASLSISWIGHIMGVGGMDIRSNPVKFRYAMGLIVFGSLNVFVLYGLGTALFGSRRVGLVAALLWLTAPLVMIYAIFAQDALYAVFFNLALLLIWLVVTSPQRRHVLMVALGIDLFLMTMLNYSWCIVSALFVVFAVLEGIRRKWAWKEHAIRVVLPLGVMTVLLGALMIHHKLDYILMYRTSREYVGFWYNFETVYQTAAALIGGQIDLFLLMGSVSTSACIAAAVRMRQRASWVQPRALFGAAILGVYAIPILLGPPSLKMEAARCWNWVASVPICIASAALLAQPRPGLFVGGAVSLSVITYTVMRLFLNFAP